MKQQTLDDRNQPGVQFDIQTVVDTIMQEYTENHELRIHTNLICGIDDMSGQCEIDFNDLTELYVWVAETRGRLGL